VSRFALAAMGLAAGLAAGCGGLRSPDVGAAGLAGPDVAWEVPSGAFGTQRLYRAVFGGPEGDGSFRATLRLAATDRFELAVADRLGRALYTLRVEGGGGWWVDHRRDTLCGDLEALELPGLADAPVAARALPPLLLGSVPAVGDVEPVEGSGGTELRDGAGRRWSVTLHGRSVSAWTLWDDEGPLWWWRREGRGGVLSGRQGRQLRWQEAVVEPLRSLPSATPPAGLREDCAAPPLR
jgi:hypothetical protein